MKVNVNKFKVERFFYDNKYNRIATFVKLLSGKVEIDSTLVSEKTGCKYRIISDGFISHEDHEKGLRGLMLRQIEGHENQECTLEVGEILSSMDK